MSRNVDSNNMERLVEQGYDKVAHDYARLEGDTEWRRLRWLNKLLNLLEPGSAVLDLGCGPGIRAGIEIAKEHHITGVDVSEVQINLARRNVPTGSFIHTLLPTSLPLKDFYAAYFRLYQGAIPLSKRFAMLRKLALKDVPAMVENSTRTFIQLRNAYKDYEDM